MIGQSSYLLEMNNSRVLNGMPELSLVNNDFYEDEREYGSRISAFKIKHHNLTRASMVIYYNPNAAGN